MESPPPGLDTILRRSGTGPRKRRPKSVRALRAERAAREGEATQEEHEEVSLLTGSTGVSNITERDRRIMGLVDAKLERALNQVLEV